MTDVAEMKKGALAQASEGLHNSQETIRFLDKKVGGAVTVVSLMLGLLVPKEFFVERFCTVFTGVCSTGLLVSTLGSVLCFCAVLWQAFKVMTACGPDVGNGAKHVLFPYAKDFAKCQRDIREKLTSGMSDDDRLDEYCDQLSTLGLILANKITHCRKMFCACLFLALFILASIVLEKLPSRPDNDEKREGRTVTELRVASPSYVIQATQK